MPLKKSGGPVVGLDIGSSFIKACEVDVRGGRANLRGIAVVPTPPGAITNGEITDPVTLGKTIQQVLKQSGIKAKQAVTSVAGQSALVVRIIEVPKMNDAELRETMKWEVERQVPFAAEQVVMDYKPLVPQDQIPDGQNMEVLLAVAQEAFVNRHIAAVQAAGLKPVAIDIEPLASSRSLLDLSNGAGPEGTVAIVDIGATTTDIGIYREGRITFTRSIPIAGNNLTKAISDVLGQPLADAERLKKEVAAIPEQPQSPAPAGDDLFGGGLGGLPTLDFGAGTDDAGGVPLGGTFGAGAAPGQTTATATQAEPEFDIAGGGFSADAFTTPAEGEAAPAAEASPFDLTADASAAPDPAGAGLAGPVPAANPFDPGAGEPEPAATATADANPFDNPVFGTAPAADPFAQVDPFGANDPFGAPSTGPAPTGVPSSGLTEEEYVKTQIADAVMPVLYELVTELRRSLDFFRNRANGSGAEQVIITGGTAKLPGLADFLTVNLDVPVAVGNPLQYLSTGSKADPGYLQDVGPVFPVSVGLAVRELLSEPRPARKR